jgi:hypothetical protein
MDRLRRAHGFWQHRRSVKFRRGDRGLILYRFTRPNKAAAKNNQDKDD